MGERVAAMAGIAPEELLPEQPGAAPAASPLGERPAAPARRGAPASDAAGPDASLPGAPNAAGSRAAGAARAAAGPVAPAPGAQGGPFRSMAPAVAPAATLGGLDQALVRLDERAALSADIFTYVESRLLQGRLQSLLVPSIAPVETSVGSGFGFRIDPFNGRQALHAGLDYPAPEGAPVAAAAGGVVASTDTHPEYGLLLVIDHGNGLATRYAHTSRILVAPGDIVRREQVVAEVGNTGRSTGPHLHFEVLVDGVPQNPARFLARGAAPRAAQARVIN
ncbi:MAG: M23 family metallopeptidase [Burkholderiales bacterium]|nr:M23 family metallopeptidase [Burkholderiales bacterium]